MIVTLFSLIAHQFFLAAILTDWIKLTKTETLTNCRYYKGTGFSFVREYCGDTMLYEVLENLGIVSSPYFVITFIQIAYAFSCISVFMKLIYPEYIRTIIYLDTIQMITSIFSIVFFKDMMKYQPHFHEYNSSLSATGMNLEVAALVFIILCIVMKFYGFNHDRELHFTKLIYD